MVSLEWHCDIYICSYYISNLYYTVKYAYEFGEIEEPLFEDGKEKFKEHYYNGDS